MRPWSDALVANIARVEEIWTESRRRLEQGGAVPVRRVFAGRRVLCARRVPVPDLRRAAARAWPATYLRALLAHPFVREWEAAALAETTVIEADEPRILYRDKLRRRAARDRDPALEALQARIRKAAETAHAAAHSRRRHQGLLRRAARGRRRRHAGVRGHRRLRADRTRADGAGRHVARGDRERDARARPDARVRAAALRRRRQRWAAPSRADCPGRGVPTPAPCAT